MARHRHHGRTDLRKSALKRLRDAQALLEADEVHTRGAMYLGGYAIECKLKAIALEVFDCYTLRELAGKWGVHEREVYTHRLEALARRLPLYLRLTTSEVWRDFVGHVNHWKPTWRYDPHDPSRERADAFLKSVGRMFRWLDSNRC